MATDDDTAGLCNHPPCISGYCERRADSDGIRVITAVTSLTAEAASFFSSSLELFGCQKGQSGPEGCCVQRVRRRGLRVHIFDIEAPLG